MTDNNVFATAFKFFTLGCCVLPSGGGESGKSPLVPWKPYQKTKPTDEQLQTWEAELNPKLWGFVTGKISNRFTIDDDKPGYNSIMSKSGLKPHRKTPHGGLHYDCLWPGFDIPTKVGILPNIDVRGEGGFANFAGRVGDKGYELLQPPTPENLILFSELPAEVQKVLRPQGLAERILQQALRRARPGKRNDTGLWLACQLRDNSVSQVEAEAIMLRYAAQVANTGSQAYTESEAVATLNQAFIRPAREAWQTTESFTTEANVVCMADVQAEAVSWLWYPYIPKGKLTLLEGDPGVGKSWLSLAIATAVSLGTGLAATEMTESAKVLLASAEDGLGDTIRPRLDAMGADVRNIHAIKGALDFGNAGLVALEAFIRQVKPSLCIIDPLVAYIGASVDIHRANQTRAVMARLASIAETCDVTILAVRHLTKGGRSKPIYRGVGSIDIAAACRSVLLAGCDPENPQKRGVVHIKSNLAPVGNAIGYELRDGGFYWTGESDLTAGKILAADDSEGQSAIGEAIEFLKGELAEGPVDAKHIDSARKSVGIAEITLRRARERVGAKIHREGETGKRGGGRWVWELPQDLDAQDAHIKENEHLNNASFKNDPIPRGHDHLNTDVQGLEYQAVLGMPGKKAIEVWRLEGAPVIHLGPGENCFDLKKLLSNSQAKREHLQAIKRWLDSVRARS